MFSQFPVVELCQLYAVPSAVVISGDGQRHSATGGESYLGLVSVNYVPTSMTVVVKSVRRRHFATIPFLRVSAFDSAIVSTGVSRVLSPVRMVAVFESWQALAFGSCALWV